MPGILFLIDWLINPLWCFFGSQGHVALDRNPGPGYNTLLLRLIPGDHLDSRVALPNSYPNALRAMQGGSLYHFYDGLWYDPAGGELTTYYVRGGHANHWANPTVFLYEPYFYCATTRALPLRCDFLVRSNPRQLNRQCCVSSLMSTSIDFIMTGNWRVKQTLP